MHSKLIDRDERRCRLLANRDGIAGVILVTMRQRHVGHAFGHVPDCVPRSLKGWVAGEERVDQNTRFVGLDTKARMAEPGDAHWGVQGKFEAPGDYRHAERVDNLAAVTQPVGQ
jgi:hypothetical protein